MSLTIKETKDIFDVVLPKMALSVLSYDNTNKESVVNSSIKWYDFDEATIGVKKLSTLDSVEIIGDSLVFAEFKNEAVKSGDKLKFLRLKATESLMSLLIILKDKKPIVTMSDVNKLKKDCYFVFSRAKSTPTKLMAFNTTHRILKSYYTCLYSKFDFIDNITFKKKFKL